MTVILGAGLLVASATAQPAGGAIMGPMTYPTGLTRTHKALKYASTSSARIPDLFVPTGTGPFAVVVNIRGGGFALGSKEMLDGAVAQALLKAGIAIASINYRISGEALFPAVVLDAKAAVRFLRANAAKYKLNGKVVAFGQSAGGNIASMLGTSGGVKEFDAAKLGNIGSSSRVVGVVNWFGPNDFLAMDAQAKAQGCAASDQTHNAATLFESKYLGAAIQIVPALAKKANPITYIDKSDAPTLVQKGDQDCTVPIQQSVQLVDALKKASVRSEYDLLIASVTATRWAAVRLCSAAPPTSSASWPSCKARSNKAG